MNFISVYYTHIFPPVKWHYYTQRVDYPPNGRYWAFSQATMKKYIESGRIKFKERYGANSRGFIFKRYRNNMEIQSEPLNSLLGTANDYMNQAATTEMLSLMGKGYFSYPKPVQFLYKLGTVK